MLRTIVVTTLTVTTVVVMGLSLPAATPSAAADISAAVRRLRISFRRVPGFSRSHPSSRCLHYWQHRRNGKEKAAHEMGQLDVHANDVTATRLRWAPPHAEIAKSGDQSHDAK